MGEERASFWRWLLIDSINPRIRISVIPIEMMVRTLFLPYFYWWYRRHVKGI